MYLFMHDEIDHYTYTYVLILTFIFTFLFPGRSWEGFDQKQEEETKENS